MADKTSSTAKLSGRMPSGSRATNMSPAAFRKAMFCEASRVGRMSSRSRSEWRSTTSATSRISV